jgi:fibrillarin-like rRNA methylase
MVTYLIPICFKNGFVYTVKFSHRFARDLSNVAKKRMNIIPNIEDAGHLHKYRMVIDLNQNCLFVLYKKKEFLIESEVVYADEV